MPFFALSNYSQEKLEHTLNGTFKSYNRSYTDSNDAEFEIKMSKIILDDKEKEIAKNILDDKEKKNEKSIFNAILGLKLIVESGNIGTIRVKCEDNEDSVLIIYIDEQNSSITEKERREDL